MSAFERAARAAADADATMHNGPNLYEANPELYRRLTRAVLLAVRKTDEHLTYKAGWYSYDYSDHFTAMIDAILSEDTTHDR